MQFKNQYIALGTRCLEILYSISTSNSTSRSFPPLPHLSAHGSQQCASTPSDGFAQCCCHPYPIMQVSNRNLTRWRSPLPIVCLACSRSCCFVLPLPCPRSLCRPKQALDATHRHYYSCMCCLFWQLVSPSILLCYSPCESVQARLPATPYLQLLHVFIHLTHFDKG
jgi:hypothetical protein